MITQKRLKELFAYDELTGIFTRLKKAHQTRKVGSIKPSGYMSIKIDLKLYQAHRLAWLYVYGSFPSGEIDHINGIKLDNSIVNLRDVNHSINMKNTKRRKDNKSGYSGVNFRRGLYVARVQIDKKRVFLGNFDNAIDAHKAVEEYRKNKGFGNNHGA